MNALHLARRIARVAIVAAAGMALASALAAAPMGHIRGTIVSATPDQLTVRTASGNVKVAIDPATKIAGIVPSSRDRIKAGTFVGIANVPGAATSRALEVVVFPDSMRGAGLGDYPWDLSPRTGGAKSSAMTNGTVTAASAGAGKHSAMTNGTVKSASSANGLLLAVDYGKGEKKILVPAGVPVVGVVPADASKLVPGAHVFVSTKKDAPDTAGFISVGLDGAVPPM